MQGYNSVGQHTSQRPVQPMQHALVKYKAASCNSCRSPVHIYAITAVHLCHNLQEPDWVSRHITACMQCTFSLEHLHQWTDHHRRYGTCTPRPSTTQQLSMHRAHCCAVGAWHEDVQTTECCTGYAAQQQHGRSRPSHFAAASAQLCLDNTAQSSCNSLNQVLSHSLMLISAVLRQRTYPCSGNNTAHSLPQALRVASPMHLHYRLPSRHLPRHFLEKRSHRLHHSTTRVRPLSDDSVCWLTASLSSSGGLSAVRECLGHTSASTSILRHLDRDLAI